MKINCVSCGHKVDLDNAYDSFEGQVKCFACGALLDVRTEDGHLRMVRLASPLPYVSTPKTLETARQ